MFNFQPNVTLVDPAFERVLLESLQALECRLRTASRERGKNGRDGAMIAVSAALEFVNSIPRLESRNLGIPLFQLLTALSDLDVGRVAPMLESMKFANRNPESTTRKIIIARAIFAVSTLVKHSMPVDDACKFVVRLFENAGFEFGGHRSSATPAWKSLKNRRNGLTRLPETDVTRATYNALHAFSFRPGTPIERVKSGLTDLINEALCAEQPR